MDAPRLIAVLPCYSLDDIAKNLDELTCQEFHACWTVLWHPGLLARTNVLPEWKRADQGSLDLEKSLVLCPTSSADSIDTPLTERLESQGCQLIWGQANRVATLALIDQQLEFNLHSVLPKIERHDANDASASFDLDLTGAPKKAVGIDDFYALGMAYLMLHALTRKVHYSNNIDVVLLADQAKSAAQAYLVNDFTECERWLQSCFDQLSQERDRYFTQSANLLDLTLVAPTTLGKPLLDQLKSVHPQNILATAGLLEQLRTANPEAWDCLTTGNAERRIGIVGGLLRERAHRWFPLGTLQRDLIRGHAAYESLQVTPPKVFSRFEGGMSIEMPTHLRSAGYIGALLHAFSDGSYPVTSQAKIAWEGTDKTSLDAISSAVLDSASYRSIFNAINELAKQFDHHQVPTLTCVHWPSRTSAAFADLLRATRRTTAFGEWKTLEDYFETTGYVYSNQTFTASQFKQPLPASYAEYSRHCQRLRMHLRRNAILEATRNIATITARIMHNVPNRESQHQVITACAARIDELLVRSDDRDVLANAEKQSTSENAIEPEVTALRSQIGEQLAKLLPRTSDNTHSVPGWLLINPFSGPRRYFLKSLSGNYVKSEDNRIYESILNGRETDLVVDVPPMGVVQLRDASRGGSPMPSGRGLGPHLASPNFLLANEFIECQVDPKNGYLRSLMIAKKRGGRLSGMPAVAMFDPVSPKKPIYSTTENARLKIVANTALHGEIESTGDLVINRKCVAKFKLRFELWRGSRAVELKLQIEMTDKTLDPARGLWEIVPIWRTAWPSQAASLSTWLQGTKSPVSASPFFGPELLEIDDAEHRLTLVYPGLAVHRRVDLSFLDTLLPVDENGVCEHRMQIAADWPRPYQSYLEFLDQPWLVADSSGPLQAGHSLWFAQTSAPNVRIDPLRSDDSLRLMLHETMGKEGRVRLSFFRDCNSASRVDFQGNMIEELQIEKGQVIIDLKPNEISYLDVG